MAGLDWNKEGKIWPHRGASSFIPTKAGTFHVQQMGKAGQPQVLLLHGTGASVHSWRGLMPLLAKRYEVIALDLPCHAFSSGFSSSATSLEGMADALAALIAQQHWKPSALIGHSAGAALALQTTVSQNFAGPIVGLNAALRPFPGPAAGIFSAAAKLLFVNPFVPRIFSGAAMFGGEAERFLYRATASRIDAEGLACYTALLRNPAHTKGALSMMANWDLPGLRRSMGAVKNRVLLIHSDKDAAIPLDWTREASGWLANSQLCVLEGLGHLAHEEAPELVAGHIEQFLPEPADPR